MDLHREDPGGAIRDPYRLLRERVPGGEAPEPGAWFREHHDGAARRVVEVLSQAGHPLEGRAVADVGCGDGTIDLGVVQHGRPASLVGFDLEPPDSAQLAYEAWRHGALPSPALPTELSFRRAAARALPAPDGAFDCVISWSTFEHVRHVVELLADVRRVLRAGGSFFLQIWPLYHSAHGAHLWPWFPEGFAHLLRPPDLLSQHVVDHPLGSATESRFLADESRALNRVRIDDLQRGLLAAGLVPTWVQLDADDVHLPVELASFELPDLAISGVTLVAEPVP